MNRTLTLLVTLSFVIFLASGCNKGPARPAGMPPLYPATITVTQEGTPLEGATVQLIAEDSSLAQWGPGGITDAKGEASLRTNGMYDGAPLGKYKVAVSKKEVEPHPHPEWSSLPYDDPNYQKYTAEDAKRKVLILVDPQISNLATTTLAIEITASEKTYSIDAGKKVKSELKTQQ